MSELSDFLNQDVSKLAKSRNNPQTGDLFGVELECEGLYVDYNGGDIRGWTPHEDGSLRKHHGSSCEWVFQKPVNYPTSIKLVKSLFEYFKGRKARLVCSNRTSMHVHYNMGDKAGYQLVNLYILFTIFEGILDKYCGEDREGNLFCLSSRYAEDQITWVEEACFKHYNFLNLREQNRYCSLNLASLNKFFSVEFRGMRGLDNEEDVLAWLEILNELTQYACYTMKSPVTVVEDISKLSPLGFMKTVFSKDSLNRLTTGMTVDDISSSVYEGLRLVQRLVYRVGSEFENVRFRKKDFWEETGKKVGAAKPLEWEDIEWAPAPEMPRARPNPEFRPVRFNPRPAGRGIQNREINLEPQAGPDPEEVNRQLAQLLERARGRGNPFERFAEGAAVRNPFNEEDGGL